MYTLQIQKTDEGFTCLLRDNDHLLASQDFTDGEAAQEWGLKQLEEVSSRHHDRIAELSIRFREMVAA